MRGSLLCLSLALLLAACYAGRREAAPADARDAEAKVYAAALDARYVADSTLLGGDAKMLLVVDETSADLLRFRERKNEMRLASREVLDDFETKNQEPRPLKSDFGLRIRTRPISAEEARSLVPVRDGIPDFNPIQEKYPEASGVVTLSRVGFNRDMTEALVEVVRGSCGKGCGEGAFVLLAREGGRWKVRDYYGGYMA
ncbi:MAG TPA: hypothetical protein VGP08_26115 [Pyrinomonadaceae bacterium]|jgi:hypothetical protein|nr:hypothetical protein [Pyrinomonadaceae bacterium]